MRKLAHTLTALSLFSIIACGDKKEESETDGGQQQTEQKSNNETSQETPAGQPKTYTVSFSPDSAILGKSSEALVKVTGSKAVALSDPDGKDMGTELTVMLQVTNKQQIDQGGSISISYETARLQLDNGNNITIQTGTDYLRAQPEATSKIESWTFEIPAGAKPAALNLFLDGTRVSLAVKMN